MEEIKTKEVYNIINKVALAIEKDGNFIFDSNGISGISDNIFIVYPFKTELKYSINSDLFQKIINNTRDEIIKLSINNNQLIIKQNKGKISINLQDIEKDIGSIINLQDIEKNKIKIEQYFITALKKCLLSISNDPSLEALSCIGILNDVVVSSDNNRITECKIKSITDNNILLPGSLIAKLFKFGDINYISIIDNWVCFINDNNAILGISSINSEFPAYKDIFKKKIKDNIDIVFSDSFIDIINSVSIMSDPELINRFIDIKISKNQILCKSGSEMGFAEVIDKISYQGQEISFSINPDFLKDILENIDSNNIKIFFNDDKIFFIGHNFKHLISIYEKE